MTKTTEQQQMAKAFLKAREFLGDGLRLNALPNEVREALGLAWAELSKFVFVAARMARSDKDD